MYYRERFIWTRCDCHLQRPMFRVFPMDQPIRYFYFKFIYAFREKSCT